MEATTGLTRAEKEKFGLEILWHTYRARMAATRRVGMETLAASAQTIPPLISEQLGSLLGRPGTEAIRRMMQP